MNRKKYSIFIIYILFITACSNRIDNKQVSHEDKIEIPYIKETSSPDKKSNQLKFKINDFEYDDGNYDIETKVITIKGKKISIPQISNINNIKKEKDINSLIKKSSQNNKKI